MQFLGAAGIAAVGVSTLLSVGCVARREPLAVVEPEYSYVRDGGLALVEPAAAQPGEALAVELQLDENGLLRAVAASGGRFVHAEPR